MPNMSYCRFSNTAKDLQDCVDNWYSLDDSEFSETFERDSRAHILALAQKIVQRFS